MLTYSQAKQCIKDLGRSNFEDLIKQYGEEVIQSAFACDINPSDIEEAYAGECNNDEDFTQQLLEDTGDMPKDFPNYICIDWERTAEEIMQDYSEDNHHYFRNL